MNEKVYKKKAWKTLKNMIKLMSTKLVYYSCPKK